MPEMEEFDNVITITPTSESIEDEADAIIKTVKGILENRNCKLIFDLSHVKYFGNSGLNLLIWINNVTCTRGEKIVIKGLRPQMQKAFKLTRLDKVFEIMPSTLPQ
jgi:anti-sigma B factor antagonist